MSIYQNILRPKIHFSLGELAKPFTANKIKEIQTFPLFCDMFVASRRNFTVSSN